MEKNEGSKTNEQESIKTLLWDSERDKSLESMPEYLRTIARAYREIAYQANSLPGIACSCPTVRVYERTGEGINPTVPHLYIEVSQDICMYDLYGFSDAGSDTKEWIESCSEVVPKPEFDDIPF